MARPTNVRWRILAVMVFISFVSYLLRGNLSIAGTTMVEDLQLTEIQWGWVMSAFPLGYALFQFPGGCWGDSKGPRLTLTLIAISWGVLIAVTSLTPGHDMAPTFVIIGFLLTVQFLAGAFHAPVFPIVVCAIERWFPVGRWALPNGLTSSGLTVGLAVTASALPWLIGQFGWRTSFLLLAPFAFAAAALWWWYARDRPEQHDGVNAAELELVTTLIERAPCGEGDVPAWRRVLKNRDALFATLSYACMNYVFYVVFSWGFYYLVTVRGFAAQEAGFLTSAQWVAGAAGAFAGGWVGDKLCHRIGLRWGCRWPILIGSGVSGLLLLVLPFINAYAAAGSGCLLLFNQFTEGAYAANGSAWRPSFRCGVWPVNTGANLMGFINAILSSVAVWLGWCHCHRRRIWRARLRTDLAVSGSANGPGG
jgi:sugar phosphate permease